MTGRRLIVVAAPPFAMGGKESFERLEKEGFSVVDVRPCASLSDDSLRNPLREAWAFISGNAPYLGPSFYELAPRLRVIAKMGAGYDNIDLRAATNRKVLVCYTPGANTKAVADYTLGLMLALCRRIPMVDRDVRAGQWNKYKGFELAGKTLALLGVGAVGRAVAERAGCFGLRLIGCDPYWPAEEAGELGIVRVELEELFSKADILSLHCPLTEDTRQVINRRSLGRMRSSALLINTARGELVDEEALTEALMNKDLAGAALDAFAEEPLGNTPLKSLENVILSPHTAWFTQEAMARMTDWTVDQIICAGDGRPPKWPINPEVMDL